MDSTAILSGAVSQPFLMDFCLGKSISLPLSRYHLNCKRERGFRPPLKNLRLGNCTTIYASCSINGRSESLRCKCVPAKNVSEAVVDNGNGSWINGVANASNVHMDQNLKHENGGAMSNTIERVSEDYIEDEAWELLRASMVYYCSNPIGTIAANDPSDSNTLNYDQVFIRDFIPSGIAFLLKGEHDIVRNFILHTLQLQVM